MSVEMFQGLDITDGPSCYSIQDGYRINQDEEFIQFYNKRFAGQMQIDIMSHMDYIQVFDKHDESNNIFIDFKRTIRVLDDERTYQLPPPQTSFPLFLARHYSSTLPEAMQQRGGIFFPMLQREALMLAFSSYKNTQRQFAIRVFTGAVNALTGQPTLKDSIQPSHQDQDYVLAPDQGLLSGYRVGDATKQFVAMPMGDKYSVEYQLTGEEFIGGIQLEIIPRLRDTVTFRRSLSVNDTQKCSDHDHLDLFSTPRSLGLRPGQRITMQDHHPRNLYEYALPHTREPSTTRVEPAASRYDDRAAFVHELFDGPSHMNFDHSTSLVLSVVKPIHMIFGPYDGFSRTISFDCSPLARLDDLRVSLTKRIAELDEKRSWFRHAKISLIIGGKTYDSSDNSVIGGLNLTSPQKVGLEAKRESERLGTGGDEPLPTGRIVSGWDMGVAMGGRIKQTIMEDEGRGVWNWDATRTVNIQIISSVAFQAVTGLAPPISPICLPECLSQSIPATPEPAQSRELALHPDRLSTVKSVNDLDWEHGTSVSMTLDGNTIILCVCCESNICDSM